MLWDHQSPFCAAGRLASGDAIHSVICFAKLGLVRPLWVKTGRSRSEHNESAFGGIATKRLYGGAC